METSQQQHQSQLFTVRLWAEDLGDGRTEWRGQVQHVLSSETHYNQSNGLHVSLEAPEQLPPLPAAVEVAAYHIVLEGLTNVARHAHARTCRICLSLADGLRLEIVDDGSGLPIDCRAGVGLTAMRERAANL